VGLVIGFVGVAVVVQGGGIDVTGARLSGDLLALSASGAWAWYGIVIGPLVGTLGALPATGWTMVIAALCFTPLSFAEVRAHAWESVSWEAWAGFVYGATVGMVMAMALWGRSIHRLERFPSRCSESPSGLPWGTSTSCPYAPYTRVKTAILGERARVRTAARRDPPSARPSPASRRGSIKHSCTK
jgi:hypothetical protein